MREAADALHLTAPPPESGDLNPQTESSEHITPSAPVVNTAGGTTWWKPAAKRRQVIFVEQEDF